jgi:hypothetical protein
MWDVIVMLSDELYFIFQDKVNCQQRYRKYSFGITYTILFQPLHSSFESS